MKPTLYSNGNETLPNYYFRPLPGSSPPIDALVQTVFHVVGISVAAVVVVIKATFPGTSCCCPDSSRALFSAPALAPLPSCCSGSPCEAEVPDSSHPHGLAEPPDSLARDALIVWLLRLLNRVRQVPCRGFSVVWERVCRVFDRTSAEWASPERALQGPGDQPTALEDHEHDQYRRSQRLDIQYLGPVYLLMWWKLKSIYILTDEKDASFNELGVAPFFRSKCVIPSS